MARLSLAENTLEPPVPAQLNDLSPALQSFSKTFAVDEFLIKAAAQNSKTAPEIDLPGLKAAIAKLSREECNDFLWKLLHNEPALSFSLKKRLETFLDVPESQGDSRRTAQMIMKTSVREREIETCKRREKQEAERRKQRKEQRERYEREIEQLKNQQSAAWEKIEQLIQKGQAKTYDEAIDLLLKLQDIA